MFSAVLTLHSRSPNGAQVWVWIFAFISVASSIASIVLYVHVNIAWSNLAVCFAQFSGIAIVLQVNLMVKGTGPEELELKKDQ